MALIRLNLMSPKNLNQTFLVYLLLHRSRGLVNRKILLSRNRGLLVKDLRKLLHRIHHNLVSIKDYLLLEQIDLTCWISKMMQLSLWWKGKCNLLKIYSLKSQVLEEHLNFKEKEGHLILVLLEKKWNYLNQLKGKPKRLY